MPPTNIFTVILESRRWLLLFVVLLTGAMGFSSYRIIPTSATKRSKVLRCNSHEKTVVIAYHKPSNVITSHSDADALSVVSKSGETRTTVYDDIQSMRGFLSNNESSKLAKNNESSTAKQSWEEATQIRGKLHAIGRLDCDTTGLLLLTNDGGLVHHVTNPTSKASKSNDKGQQHLSKDVDTSITKTYEALIMGHHENSCANFEKMRTEGVDIGAKYGGCTKPVQHLEVLRHPTPKTTLVSITISEGRNRQVRRMFHSINSGVMKLKRTTIGTLLTLKGLNEGQWRIMSDDEVQETLGWKVRPIEATKLASRRHGERSSENSSKTPPTAPPTRRKHSRRKRR